MSEQQKLKYYQCPKGGKHELVTTVNPTTKKCSKCGRLFVNQKGRKV